jgi:hypothetical protein
MHRETVFEGGEIGTLDIALVELRQAREERDRAFAILRRLGKPPEGHDLFAWWEARPTGRREARIGP